MIDLVFFAIFHGKLFDPVISGTRISGFREEMKSLARQMLSSVKALEGSSTSDRHYVSISQFF